MCTEREQHRRRSLRLPAFDYSREGAYYVTICVNQRLNLLGEISGEEAKLNEAGMMIRHGWLELPRKFPGVQLDEFIIMPNHFHGIIIISEPDSNNTPIRRTRAGVSLPEIVQWFKTMTTNAYIRGVRDKKWSPFLSRLWQRNYYERIIRDETELSRFREYIVTNPARWGDDEDNVARLG